MLSCLDVIGSSARSFKRAKRNHVSMVRRWAPLPHRFQMFYGAIIVRFIWLFPLWNKSVTYFSIMCSRLSVYFNLKMQLLSIWPRVNFHRGSLFQVLCCHCGDTAVEGRCTGRWTHQPKTPNRQQRKSETKGTCLDCALGRNLCRPVASSRQ